MRRPHHIILVYLIPIKIQMTQTTINPISFYFKSYTYVLYALIDVLEKR